MISDKDIIRELLRRQEDLEAKLSAYRPGLKLAELEKENEEWRKMVDGLRDEVNRFQKLAMEWQDRYTKLAAISGNK